MTFPQRKAGPHERAIPANRKAGRAAHAFGVDVLAPQCFDRSDHLNELFECGIKALTGLADADFDALIGTHATITIEGRDGPLCFDGTGTQTR